MSSRLQGWLAEQEKACPAAIPQHAWRHVVSRAATCFAVGLDHYRSVFHELGWSGKRHGLDVGSGPGHWALAFAFDNQRASGVDKFEAFVCLANRVAAEFGLTERICHQLGRAETLRFPNCHFDAVWSHGVLMFCNIEDAASEIARVLEPGGHFYCGYSTIGFRLAKIHESVLARRRDFFEGHLRNYIGSTLQRCGISRSAWSQVRCATAEELAVIGQVFGLSLLRSPGLQDECPGYPDFAGIPVTIDLLCRRDDDGGSGRAALFQISATSEAGRRRFRDLARLGLGKLVMEALRERGEPLDDPEVRSVYALAGIRAGRGDKVAAELGESGLDPLVRGLLALDCQRSADAVAAFRSLRFDHPDRNFLLGAALLHSGDAGAAAREFDGGAEAGRRPVECGFGAMLARFDIAGWPEQSERMAKVLRALPTTWAANPEKIEALIEALAASRAEARAAH